MRRSLVVRNCLVMTALLFFSSACLQPVLTSGDGGGGTNALAGESERAGGQSTLLYLTPDQDGILQLGVTDYSSGQSRVLTGFDEGLIDFAVSPDGNLAVFAAWNEAGGADLWSISLYGANLILLVPCPDAACGRAVWSPDGTQIVYERHGGGQTGNVPAGECLAITCWDPTDNHL